MRIQATQTFEHLLPITLAVAQAGQQERRRNNYPLPTPQFGEGIVSAPPLSRTQGVPGLGGGGLVMNLCRHPQQRRLGTDLQADRDPLLVQGRNTIPKTDGLAHMAHPVGGCRDLGTRDFAGNIRDERHFRRVIAYAFGHRRKGGQHRFHQR